MCVRFVGHCQFSYMQDRKVATVVHDYHCRQAQIINSSLTYRVQTNIGCTTVSYAGSGPMSTENCIMLRVVVHSLDGWIGIKRN